MTTQYDYGRRGSGTFYSLVLVLLIGAVCLGVFVHQARQGVAGRLAAMITGRPLNIVSAPMVVDKVQRLNRLESVVYSLDTVVEGDKSSAILPDVLAGDKLLMIVHGQSIAGVDMSQMKPDDVQITEGSGERSIKLVLPPSQVFVTTIDNAHTRVYSRDTERDPCQSAATAAAGCAYGWHSRCSFKERARYGDGDARRARLRAR